MNSDVQREALKLRNQLSFLCAGMSVNVVASAMSDLLVEVYRKNHPSPSVDDYLEQMRATYEYNVAQERQTGNA